MKTEVSFDVREIEARSFFGIMTRRQFCCVGATIVAIFAANLICKVITGSNLSMDALIMLSCIVAVPICAFMFKVQGLYMEKFLKLFLFDYLLKKEKRVAAYEVFESKVPPLSAAEEKELRKKMKEYEKVNPSLHGYK